MLRNYVYYLVYTHGELRQKVAASETERLKDGDDICPLNEEGSKSQIKWPCPVKIFKYANEESERYTYSVRRSSWIMISLFAIWLYLVLIKVKWVLLLCWMLSPIPYHLFITFISKEMSGRKRERFNHPYSPLTWLYPEFLNTKKTFTNLTIAAKLSSKTNNSRQTNIDTEKKFRRIEGKQKDYYVTFYFCWITKQLSGEKKARVSKALCSGLLVRVCFLMTKILNG